MSEKKYEVGDKIIYNGEELEIWTITVDDGVQLSNMKRVDASDLPRIDESAPRKEKFGTEFSRAVKEWQASASYALDANDGILYCSKYREDLETRLLHAFTAGWNARAVCAEHAALKDEWIPISDDLPKGIKLLWQFTGGNEYLIGIYDGSKVCGQFHTEFDLVRFCAYRPLPESYQPV